MSKNHIEKITCPECEKESDFLVWDSYNVDLDPDKKDSILKGEQFEFTCPHCGHKEIIPYPFLYHDMTHKLMCYYCREADVEDTVKSINDMAKNRVLNIVLEAESSRVTTDYSDLLEKIEIFEAGYDDRVIELLKYSILQANNENPENEKIGRIIFGSYKTEQSTEFALLICNENSEITSHVTLKDISDYVEQFKNEIKDETDTEYVIDQKWVDRRFKKLNKQDYEGREKQAFIIRWNPKDSVYSGNAYVEDLKNLKKKDASIYIETGNNEDIWPGDVAFIVMKNPKGLAAIGRFETPSFEGELTDGTKRYLAKVKLEFIFSRFVLNDYENHYLFGRFFKSTKETGDASELLKKEEALDFLREFVCMTLSLNNPSPKLSFNKNEDFREKLCMYINDFDPVFKKMICLLHGVDPNESNLTYHREKILEHPKRCIETERLYSIIVPDKAEIFSDPVENFFELKLGEMDLKFDARYEKANDGSYQRETKFTSAELRFTDVYDPPVLNVQVREDGKITMDGNNQDFFFLPGNTHVMSEDLKRLGKDNQGMIEAGVGKTKDKKNYVYRIIKELQEPVGVEYQLILQIHNIDHIANITGKFKEINTTGVRDSMVYSLMHSLELLKTEEDGSIIGWWEDPYDKHNEKGALMNKSEAAWIDECFPHHPLSVCRRFLKSVIDNN